jgi:hypothetical protein
VIVIPPRDFNKLFFLLHYSSFIFREDANLLTEEGKMLQDVQRDDMVQVDMDDYISRLHSILDRKTHLITMLQDRIENARSRLAPSF